MISILGMKAKSISLGVVLSASTLFFIVSNLGVWYFYYPHNWAGLSSCFILAIPFFVNSLMGDLFYTSLLQFSFNKLKQFSFTIAK
jgi:hypothetical protein